MIEMLNPFAEAWWAWMSAMFWQVGLLVVFITGLDMMIRRWAWPQVRYALWLLVLVKLAIPPSWTMQTSAVSWIRPQVEARLHQARVDKPVEPDGAAHPLTDAKAPAARVQADGPARPSDARISDHRPAERASGSTAGIRLPAMLFLIWIAGMAVFSSLLILKMARLRKWHRQQDDRAVPGWFHDLLVQTARRLNLNAVPAIVFAKDAATPAVYGMFRPVLLLPKQYFDRLSREEAEHVLLHELCHLKRGDLWLHGIGLALQVIYWFNPFLIWARRQMKHVREICCDLSVASVLREKTHAYRNTLLNTARDLLTESVEPGLGLLGVFEEPFRLVTRLRWLEKKTWENRGRIALMSVTSPLLIAACILPMAGVRRDTGMNPPADGKPEATLSFILDGDKLILRRGAQAVPDLDVRLKTTDPFTAAVLSRTGDPDAGFESAMRTLQMLMHEQNLHPLGDPFFRMITDPDEVENHRLVWEVGLPIRDDGAVQPPLVRIRVPARQVASTSVTGLNGTGEAWDRFIEQVQARDWIPCFPPAVEIYRDPPEGKPMWWRTEMQIQAFRQGVGYPGVKVTATELGPGRVLLLPVEGSYAQYPDVLNRLRDYVRENRIPVKDRMFGIHYSDPQQTPPDEYYWEVGCELSPGRDVPVEAPFFVRDIVAGQYASCVMDVSPDRELPWAAFITQSIFEGYVPVGPAVEAWKENPHIESKLPGKTQMLIPVAPAGNFAEGMSQWIRSFVPLETETGDADSAERETSLGSDRPEKITHFLRGLREPSRKESEFQVRTAPETWAVVLPASGSLDQMHVLFEKLDGFMSDRGIEPAGPPFVQKFNSEGIVGDLDLLWRAGYFTGDSVSVRAPFEIVRLPEREILRFHFTESRDQKAWNIRLAAWLYHHNYRTKTPHTILWTGGPVQPGRPVPPFDVEVEVEEMAEPFPEVDVYTRSAPGRYELILPMKGHFGQENPCIERLREAVRKKGIETLDDPFVRYKGNEEIQPKDEIEWEVGVPVREHVRVESPFRIEWRGGHLLACAAWEGDHLNIPKPFWISYTLNFTMNGYMAAGLPRKVLRRHIRRDEWKVELQWPVNK